MALATALHTNIVKVSSNLKKNVSQRHAHWYEFCKLDPGSLTSSDGMVYHSIQKKGWLHGR